MWERPHRRQLIALPQATPYLRGFKGPLLLVLLLQTLRRLTLRSGSTGNKKMPSKLVTHKEKGFKGRIEIFNMSE